MIRRLLDRRVPQFVALYVAGGWGFVQFVDWAVDEYLLAPALTTFVAVLLLLFIPTVVVIAWRHGAPGRDLWRRTDAAAIALNVAGAATVLFFAFRGQELGAMTTLRLVEDAEGDTVQRVVPKAEFRRSVLLYDFDNESGDSDLDWLENGFVQAVEFDLLQDVFMTPEPSDGPVRERLAEEGFAPGDEIPLALKRAAAQQRGTGHFLDGTFRRDGDSLFVRTRLYETRTGRQVASRDYRTAGPLEVADRISLDLRRDLGIPEGQIDQSVDLPAAELLTDDVDAYRAYVEVAQQGVRENDPAGGLAKAERAVAMDSTFAAAHLARMMMAVVSGDEATATEAAGDVNRFDYRLPERVRLMVQVNRYLLIEGDPDGAIQAARYWTEVYPQDLQARRMLALAYAQTGDRAAQIGEYRALLAIDPTDVEALRYLATALSQEGHPDSALAYRYRLVESRPSDLTARLDLAWTLETLGRYEESRDVLEQAAIVAPDAPEVPRQLALLDMRAGDYESARRRVEKVRMLARTPQQRERTAGIEETYYYLRGQYSRLAEAYRDRLALLAEVYPPIAVPGLIANSEFLLFAARAGRDGEALAQIDSLRHTAEYGFDLGLEWAAVRIHLDRGDFDAARASLDGIERQMEMRGATDGRLARAAWVRGRLAELEAGDCQQALGHFDSARELAPRSSLYSAARLHCLTRLERWREAEEEVDWLLEHYSGYPHIQVTIARYHAARGRVDRALDQLDAALATWAEADPDYAPAREARELRRSLGRGGGSGG